MKRNYLTISQVAQKLSLGASTLRKMCLNQAIPDAVKPGNQWLIPLDSLEKITLPNQSRGWELGKPRARGRTENTLEVPSMRNATTKIAHKIAVFNQAGGVGKTTFVRDFGYELSRRGKKTLIVDADPQGTLGVFMGMEPAIRPETDSFWHSVYSGNETQKPKVLPTGYENLFVGIANRDLKRGELELMDSEDKGRLRGFLRDIQTEFDFLIFDCPPSISEITVQILFAVDSLIIPVQTEAKAVVAFGEVQVEIAKAQKRRLNLDLPKLQVLGVVPTMYKGQTIISQHHLRETHELCEAFGYPPLPAIRDFTKVSAAGTYRVPLMVHDRNCPANRDMEQVVDQLFPPCPQQTSKM
ncbi:MAG: AAA family ATPase [Blastocatellia bacterium]|nr:AAA family ATPase [Blastocatellia bacterium]